MLPIVILLWAPLGCATLDRFTTRKQDPVPTESQLVQATREVSPGGEAGNRANLPEHPANLPEGRAELDSAINSYLAKLEQGGDPATTFHKLAALCVKKGDFERAADYYRQALRHMSPNADVASDYGYCLALLGRYHEAEDVLRKTLQMDPGAVRARNNLGLVLAATGRRELAREAFRQAGADQASTDENLEFAAAWSERTSQAAAGGLPQDPSDLNSEARRLASIDRLPLLENVSARQGEGRIHQLTSFADSPSQVNSSAK